MSEESNKATILVADDNPDILRLIQVNLKFEGYSTIPAEDGEQALELARSKKPDLIILDVLMPKLDGWQVLSHLKSDKNTRDIPVIMLTGVSMKEGKERGLIQGVEDYLSKPFNPLRLMEVIAEVISRRKMASISPLEAASKPINVGIIAQGQMGQDLVQTLSGSVSIKLAAFCDVDENALSTPLVKEMGGVEFCEDPLDIVDKSGLDLIVDTRDFSDESIRLLAINKNIEILQGLSVSFFRRLLEEQANSHLKERSLIKELNTRVKELSILNEMAQLLTMPLDLWFLLDKISLLASRVSNVEACTLLIYDEEQEKFVVSNILGLEQKFSDKAKISLSDPIAEEIMTMRRPLEIPDMNQWNVSPIMTEAISQGMKSMAAIPLFSKEKLLGLILVFSSIGEGLAGEDVNLLSILAGQAGFAVENAQLYETTLRKQHQVENLLSKLIQVQEEDRKRLAADIHDTIAQSLVSIHTRVQTCLSILKKDPQGAIERLESQLEDLKDVVSDNVKEVRQIIFNLRPSSLDDLGLIPSLENYIKRFEKEHGIFVEFSVNRRDKRLSSSVETAVFRIIQEALTNIKKHSGAQNVVVRLSLDPKTITLRVIDDGSGFSWQEVSDKFLKGDSHGIQGMKERVSLMGGNFKVSAEQDKGCMVVATIPLLRKTDKSDLDEKKVEHFYPAIFSGGR